MDLTAKEKDKSMYGNRPYPRTEMAYPKAPDKKHKVPSTKYDLAELYSPKAKYTAEEKLAAVLAYVMTGSIRGVVRLTGLKQQVVSDWKNNSSWWPDCYMTIKRDKQEEVDGSLTTIIHAANGEMLDRIINGDEIINKNGDAVRRKMTGKELAWVMGISFDKRALLRGDPTSRTEKVDTKQQMADLRKEFGAMAREHLNLSVIKIVEPED